MEENRKMSQFCEELMGVTESLDKLTGPDDRALVICSDGNTLAKRVCGNGDDLANMIYCLMLSDPGFIMVIHDAWERLIKKSLSETCLRALRAKPVELPEDGIPDFSSMNGVIDFNKAREEMNHEQP